MMMHLPVSKLFFRYSLGLVLFLFSITGHAQSYNMTTGTVTTCSGTFYDDGGPTNNYGCCTVIKETFESGNGNRLKFDFTSIAVLNSAYLQIYDGPNDTYPLIGTYGTTSFSVQSTGSSLTFVFTPPSFASTTRYAGWEANISCTTPTLTPYTMTNGTVTTCSGVFFDPGGPSADYANSTNRVQTFSSGSSSFINLQFTNFSVQLGDTLFAYDGTSTSAPMIGAYTGSDLPENISSLTGGSLTFKFVSNASSVSSGWKALINCAASADPGTIFNMQNGTRYVCSGTFYDDGGLANNYGCCNVIKETFVSSTGSRLKFDFTSIAVLNSAYLQIYDGPNDTYPLIGTYGTTSFSVQSTGTSLTFVFTPPSFSSTTRYAGWEANISCTTPTLTPYTMTNGTVTTCSGVFFDPGGPSADYTNSINRVQTFSSGSSSFINFQFTNFSVQLGDTLFAYDGTSTSAPMIGAYTGSSLPETISSLTGGSITFNFVSNSASVSSGWKALISCASSANPASVFNMQNGTRYVCSGTFYDDGGISNNYGCCNVIKETFVSSTGSRLKFDFTSITVQNSAYLSIYDGPNDTYPLIGTYGTTSFSVQSTGTSLTFVFTPPSFSSTTRYAGWEANISCTTPTLTPYTMTNGTVTACSGVFFDPGGPSGDYANSINRVQTFSSGSSSFMNMAFTNFSLATGDTLFAYDGTSTTSPLIGAYVWGDLPETISSLTGSSLTFKFVSNATSVSSGWKGLISCTSSANPATVFNMQNGVRYLCSGTFYDDGGLANNYGCCSTIKETFVSSTGSRLKFNFTSITVQNSAYLSIYDGPNDTYPLIGTYGTTSFSVQSTGSSLTFVFTPPSFASTTRYAGWEANISCTTPTLTPYTMTNGTVTACSGVFFDPGGPSADYANSINRVQTFSSGSSSFINFQFTNFSVQIGDTLFAYDGTSTSAPMIGAYTGSDLPENISSLTGGSLTFKFVSNASSVSSGWKALINCAASANPGTIFNMQNGTRYVCSGTFYDDGGLANNYSCCNTIKETFVSSTGNRLKLNFTSITVQNSATLKIYDGPNDTYPLIGTYGTTSFSVQSSGTSLTCVFTGPSGSSTTRYAGWEANISCTSIPVIPVADFSTPSYTICSGSCLTFTDLSTNSPNSWNWQFQGAAVSTSTVQNPIGICYNTAGTYTVSLTASNSVGSSVSIKTITVLPSPSLTLTPLTASVCAGQSVSLSASGANTYSWSTSATSSSITVSPTTNTTYTVTGTDANGCTAKATRLVNVSALPVLSISGSTALCTGQSTTLTATGASSYIWNTGATTNSITLSPTVNTSYTVTGTNAAGCVASASRTVTVGTSLNVTISPTTTAICAGQNMVLTANGATTYTWSTAATSSTILISPVSNTVYTVTGKTSAGCTGTASVNITVNALPSVSLTIASPVICSGQSTALIAGGANTYTWSSTATSSSITVSPTTTTTYTVTGKDVNGCVAKATGQVTVNASPSLTVSSSNTLICTGESASLLAAGASTYSWSTGATASGISVSPTVTTTYTVTGFGTNGCSSKAVLAQNVSLCTGVESITAIVSGKVYPNPFSNVLVIDYASPVRVSITNVLGETVYVDKHNTKEQLIDTNHFPSGIYYVEITGTERTVFKVVKQ